MRYDRHGLARSVWDRRDLDVQDAAAAAHDAHQARAARGFASEAERRAWLEGPDYGGGSHRWPKLSAICVMPGARKRNGANARLVAAAPHLLHAARLALSRLIREGGDRALVLELALAVGTADGTYVRADTPVDDRAPLDIHGRCKGSDCRRPVASPHASGCGWLRTALVASRAAWPLLHDEGRAAPR